VREFATSIGFTFIQYLVFAHQVATWYAAAMQLFTR